MGWQLAAVCAVALLVATVLAVVSGLTVLAACIGALFGAWSLIAFIEYDER